LNVTRRRGRANLNKYARRLVMEIILLIVGHALFFILQMLGIFG